MGRSQATAHPDVVIVGAGIAGLATAWRLCLGGMKVTILDPNPARAATWTAAGMLAPVTELAYGEAHHLALTMKAAERWPSFAEELEAAAEHSIGFQTCGTLYAALDAGDATELKRLQAFHGTLGLESSILTATETRDLEPLLSPTVRSALIAPGDHQVDNRLAGAALITAVERAGVHIEHAFVTALDGGASWSAGRDNLSLPGFSKSGGFVSEAPRIRVRTDDGSFEAPIVIICAGSWSPLIAGIPDPARPAVRPVRGESLRLGPGSGESLAAARQPLVSHNVRALVHGRPIYLVPRATGEIVIGATSDERGYGTGVLAGGVRQLLDDAREVVPGIDELELIDTSAGLRPATPDNLPLLGPTVMPGLLLATGYWRNGILLAPLMADMLASYLLAGEQCPQEYSPERFSTPAGSL